MFKALLSELDIFGIPVILTFAGNEKSKSRIGLFCSLLFFSFVGWTVYNGSKDLFTTSNPKTISFESYNENPKPMSLSADIFPIAIGVQAPDTLAYELYINDSIFKIVVVHSLLNRVTMDDGSVEERWTFTDISTEICTPGYFGELAESFSLIDLENVYCISKKQPKLEKIIIEGAFESAVYSSLDIKMIQCSDENSEVPCATQDILDKYLLGGWFNVYYINTVINPKNYSRPESHFKDLYYTMVTPTNYKNTEIDLGHIEITTDSGWITEDEQTTNHIKINKVTESIQFEPHPEKVLMLCVFQVSKLENYFTRAYKKVQDVLADAGGLSNIVQVMFLILTTPYLKLKFQESLMNELFDVELPSSKTIEKKNTKKLNKRNNTESGDQSKPQLRRSESKEKQKKGLRLGGKRLGINLLNNLRSSTKSTTKRVESGKEDNLKGDIQVQCIDQLNDCDSSIKEKGIEANKASRFSWQIRVFTPTQVGNADTNKNIKNVSSSDLSADFQDKSIRDDSMMIGFVPNRAELSGIDLTTLKGAKKEMGNQLSFLSESPSLDFKQKEIENDLLIQGFERQIEKIDKEKGENVLVLPPDLMDDNLEEKGKSPAKFPHSIVRQESQGKMPEVFKVSRKTENKINLTLWEYLSSFIYQSSELRQKLSVLKEGVKCIEERLDVVNIMKKLREVDKLKALLLSAEQNMLFNHLPKPEIHPAVGNNTLKRSVSLPHKALKETRFIEGEETEEQVIEAFKKLKLKMEKTVVDERLLEILNSKNM